MCDVSSRRRGPDRPGPVCVVCHPLLHCTLADSVTVQAICCESKHSTLALKCIRHGRGNTQHATVLVVYAQHRVCGEVAFGLPCFRRGLEVLLLGLVTRLLGLEPRLTFFVLLVLTQRHVCFQQLSFLVPSVHGTLGHLNLSRQCCVCKANIRQMNMTSRQANEQTNSCYLFLRHNARGV